MSLNQCQFIGNLGADPESRSFQNGGKVCNLRLAVNEKWKDKDGQRQERTEWISVAIFGEGLAGVAERYLRKGSKVFVSGQLQTRKWQSQDGSDRYSTEVVLRGPSAILEMLDGPQRESKPDGGASDPSNMHGGPHRDDLDDDIPF